MQTKVWSIINRGATALAALAIACALQTGVRAQNVGSIKGVVTDPSAAVIPNATVVATGNGVTRSVKTDNQGRYSVPNVPPGKYNVRADASGFVPYISNDVDVPATQAVNLDIALQIATEAQQVSVNDTSAAQLSTDSSSNVSALVLKEEDLEQLPDDPDDLQADLEALAGPSAGPNGAQFFIDGFSGGQLPPKSSIREIRINSNPFSSEFDTPGFGRIEILTKPGTDNFHGQVFFNYGNKDFDTRNPLLTTAWPAYSSQQFNANIGGPINKKSSFFLDYQRRSINENALVDAQYLNPAYAIVPFNQAVVTPNERWEINPRLDYQLNANNTLVMRYNHMQASNEGGVGGFNLPDQETQTFTKNNMVQITETAVLGTVAVDETRFQFRSNNADTNPFGDPAIPGINVSSAFYAGGSPFVGTNYTDTKGYELANTVTLSRGSHALKIGARARQTDLLSKATSNFNGSWTFSTPSAVALAPGGCLYGVTNPTSLDLYQQTESDLFGSNPIPASQVLAEGCGPTQLTLSGGIPGQNVGQFDLGAFVQDDWRLMPNLTVNMGLRYETQDNIRDHNDWAPRVGIAWAPGAKGKTASKTVVRAGYGIFYTRFAETNLLQALRYNGVEQTNYSVNNPYTQLTSAELAAGESVSSVPGYLQAIQALENFNPNASISNIPTSLLTVSNQAIYTIDPSIKAPSMNQAAIEVDRQLPGRTQLSVNYVNTRGVHVLRERDINAPCPEIATAACPDPAGVRPFSGTTVPNANGDIYQYETSGIFKQTQLTVNANTRLNSHLQLQGYYVYGQAHTNANGFPMDQYNDKLDWGRAAFDVRNRAFIGGTIGLPLRAQVAPFVTMQSGAPFNITDGLPYLGEDDGLNNARPALAPCASAQFVTKAGCFTNNPLPGQALVPAYYGDGPAQFSVNLRISRTWGWGEKVSGNPNQGGGPGGGGPPGGGGGRGGGGGFGGGGRGGGGFGGGGRGGFGGFGGGNTGKRYNLTLNVEARNALNHVNYAAPIGVLGSPFFAESTAINNGNSAAGNRKVTLQLRFQF